MSVTVRRVSPEVPGAGIGSAFRFSASKATRPSCQYSQRVFPVHCTLREDPGRMLAGPRGQLDRTGHRIRPTTVLRPTGNLRPLHVIHQRRKLPGHLTYDIKGDIGPMASAQRAEHLQCISAR